MSRVCRVDGETITNSRLSRSLLSRNVSDLTQYFKTLFGSDYATDDLSKHVCSHCLNKISKIKRLDDDIQTRVEKDKRAKEELMQQLSAKLNTSLIKTPVKSGQKRSLQKTPTPVKNKKVNVHKPTPKKFVTVSLFYSQINEFIKAYIS